ncbi:hypothetical protein V6N13_007832 [Hibiscus sabdariffa]
MSVSCCSTSISSADFVVDVFMPPSPCFATAVIWVLKPKPHVRSRKPSDQDETFVLGDRILALWIVQ